MIATLLKPTGPSTVGTCIFDLFDENRPEVSYPQGRLIPIQIYFPIALGQHLPQPKIIERRAPQTFPPLNAMGLSKLIDLSHLDKNQHSLVIFNHGNNVRMNDYALICEDLASHGYVVITIQHQLDTDITQTSFWSGRSISKHSTIINNLLYVFEWAKDNNTKLFKDTLDTNKVALIGHSMGGNALLMLAQRTSGTFKPGSSTLLHRDTDADVKECIVFLDGEAAYPRTTTWPILFCLSEERKPYHQTSLLELCQTTDKPLKRSSVLDDLQAIGHSFNRNHA